MTKKGDKKREATIPEPQGVKEYKNIVYFKKGLKKLFLDVYRPQKEGIFPLIVVVHGGGWVYGDKELYHKYAKDLARRNFVVICFDYTLAPKAHFPTQIEELDHVLAFAKLHSKQYGYHPNYCFLSGDSAGAQMAATYATAYSNKEYGKLFSLSFPLAIKGVGLNCGTYCRIGSTIIDPKTIDKALQKGQAALLKAYVPFYSVNDPRLDILSHITSQFPPAYVLTSEADFIKSENPKLLEAFDKANVKYVFKEYKSKEGNKLQHVFHLTINEEHAIIANNEELAFFNQLSNEGGKEK
jgi:acetyl esterase/lipase